MTVTEQRSEPYTNINGNPEMVGAADRIHIRYTKQDSVQEPWARLIEQETREGERLIQIKGRPDQAQK